MTDAVEMEKAEVVEMTDIETGDLIEEGGTDDDPNKKSCYTPIVKQANELYENRIHPAILPVQEKVYPIYEEKVVPVIAKVGEFFDEDIDDPIPQEEVADEEGNVTQRDATLFKISPACFGAAVLGFGVGTIVAGPFVAVAAGAGAAYATSRPDKAGEYSTYYGRKTYNGLYRGYKHSKKTISAISSKFTRSNSEENNTESASLEAA